MTLTEIQKEAATLAPDSRKKLMGFLVMLELRQDNPTELQNKIEDRSDGAWISLDEAKRRLHMEV